MIITIAVSSSGFSWSNHICRVYQQYNVNARFRQCVKKLRPLLPRVHYPSGQPGIISVCKLIRQYGSGSGLLLEIKRIISHPRWNSAWLRLVMEGLGKFIIFNIFWRKGSKWISMPRLFGTGYRFTVWRSRKNSLHCTLRLDTSWLIHDQMIFVEVRSLFVFLWPFVWNADKVV